MAPELTGIAPGGAKVKVEVGEDTITVRGAWKGEVPFEEVVAEARGTLLLLSFRGQAVEVSAGSRAGALAAKIRSPPSRLDRLGVEHGVSAAVAGPLEPAFRSELATRAIVAAGVPREPVHLLFLSTPTQAALDAVAKVSALIAPGGALWVVHPADTVPESRVAAAGKAAGLRHDRSVRFSPGHSAARLVK